jgi:hypothetical protein
MLSVGRLASASATDLCINGNTLSSCSSSLRFKKNVHDLTWGTGMIAQLRPVTFEWRERGEADFGFIAEEVAEINPLLVTYKDGRVEGVKYDQLSAVLVNAMKELKAENEQLKYELEEIKKHLGMQ